MYALHPITVHFPIALLLASTLFTFLALRRAGEGWELSAYHCLIFGCLSGVIALLTGLPDAIGQLTGPDAPRNNGLVGWVNAHAFSMLGAMIIYTQALLRRRRSADILTSEAARRGYLRLHVAGALLLLVGGWLGGHLVYVLKVGIAN
jgi:uncharacterized membrane protein